MTKMIYCLEKIIEIVEEQIKLLSGNKVLIRIDNFQDPNLYLSISSRLKDEYESRGYKYYGKMSNNKYNDFNENSNYKYVLNDLKNKDFVDIDNQMTRWRNIVSNEKTLIVLMATEAVEDRGGLADFYVITPSSIENKAKNKYSELFKNKFNDIIFGNEFVIDNIYKFIFQKVPNDILKLSNYVDSLKPNEFETIIDIVNDIFITLYANFGIPNILREHLKE